MLSFFPTPYKDETLHSIIARYVVYSGLNYPTYALKDLFEKANYNSNNHLPFELEKLASVIPKKEYDADYLLLNHTLYKFYTAFKPAEREKVKEMMQVNAGNISTGSFISNGTIKKNKLYHCLDCIENDLRIYGESYWRRTYQVPGVLICPIHHTPLVYSEAEENISKKSYASYTVKRSEILKKAVHKEIKENHYPILIKYSKEVYWMLNTEEVFNINRSIQAIYKASLRKLGYAIGDRYIQLSKIKKDLITFYGEDILSILESPFRGEYGWLVNLFRKHSDPIKHLLLIIFIYGSLNDFIKQFNDYELLEKDKDKPFGEGPWLCLNPAHSKYNKRVVYKHSLRKNKNNLIGEFECECGFIYSRRYKLPDIEDEYKVASIIEYGDIWRRKFCRLINKGYSIMEVSKILKIAPKTVRRYVNILNLEDVWYKHHPNYTKRIEVYTDRGKYNGKQKLINKRRKWKSLIQQNGYEVSRKNHYNLYRWLLLNDNEWLQDYKKKKGRRREYGTIHKKRRIEKEEEIIEKIEKVAQNWSRYEQEKPVQKTKSAIVRCSKISYNNRQGRVLNYLSQITESNEEFFQRKLNWAYNTLSSNKEELSRMKIRSLIGGISPKHRKVYNQFCIEHFDG